MHTLMLRGLDPALMARIKVYASKWGVGRTEAAVRLIEAGADHLDARTAGADATNRGLTAEQRSASARAAVRARWAKRAPEPPLRDVLRLAERENKPRPTSPASRRN